MIKPEEILYVPYCSYARWAGPLNDLLLDTFNGPKVQHRAEEFRESRILQLDAHKAAMQWLNHHKPKGVLFGSLNQGYLVDILSVYMIEKAWGFVHGSLGNHYSQLPHFVRMKPYEKGLFESVDEVLVATDSARRSFWENAWPVGLPVFGEAKKPSKASGILFNHRLDHGKGVEGLFDLPEWIQLRITASIPEGWKFTGDSLRKVLGRFVFMPEHEEYLSLLSEAGYVLSLSKMEGFCYSIVEAVMEGKCAIVMDTDWTPFAEYLPKSMRVRDVMEIPDRISWFDRNPKQREKAVLEAQASYSRHAPERWVRHLCQVLGAGK